MNVEAMLCPASIAVIGATEKSGFGRRAVENLMSGDCGDRLYLVNPRREQVFGKKCYRSISEIGRKIDLAVICTPMAAVNDIMREAGECGARAAVVYASGYGESGPEGRLAQKRLVEIAGEYGMAVCGPNCGGFINNVDGIYGFGLDMHGRRPDGNIGLVSQSGQICSMMASVTYMNFSYLISSGNCAVTGVEDYLEFLVEDEATKVVAVYLEGVTKPAKFVGILKRAAELRKPLIILKVGSSEKAKQATTAHTGSLAGDDAAFDALFKKYGVIRVNDIEDLLETCLMFSILEHRAPVDGIGIMSLSGGEAAIFADACKANRLNLAETEEATKDKIRAMLPDFATVNNPLDMTSTLVNELDCYRAAVRAMINDKNIGLIAMGHNPAEKVPEDERYIDFGFADSLAEINREAGKPIVILPGLSRKRDPELREFYAKNHIAMAENPKYGLAAVRRYMDFCLYKAEERSLEAAVPEQKNGRGARILSEHESKELLKSYGVPVPKEILAESAAGLDAVTAEIGFPLVMKIESADIPHKTEAGGVRLNIKTPQEARLAFDEILANAKSYKPDAVINGVLVQQMLPKGTEIILGINRDPQFGPMVLVGLGGVFTELFKDCALYPAPLNRGEAMEMISSLKALPLLRGYRGGKPLDVEALASLLVQLGRLAVEKKDSLKELDMNPVFVYEKGVCAADALIVLEQ